MGWVKPLSGRCWQVCSYLGGGAGGHRAGMGRALPGGKNVLRKGKMDKDYQPSDTPDPRSSGTGAAPLHKEKCVQGLSAGPQDAGLVGGLCCGRNRDRLRGGEWPGFRTPAQGPRRQVGCPRSAPLLSPARGWSTRSVFLRHFLQTTLSGRGC